MKKDNNSQKTNNRLWKNASKQKSQHLKEKQRGYKLIWKTNQKDND